MSVVRGVFEFVVGDDWTAAVGVIAALAVAGALAHHDVAGAYWAVPVVILAVLAASVRRALTEARRG